MGDITSKIQDIADENVGFSCLMEKSTAREIAQLLYEEALDVLCGIDDDKLKELEQRFGLAE